MKNLTLFNICAAAYLFLASSISSARVWTPTNEDSQFANTSALWFNLSTGEKFGIFEDTTSLSSVTANALIDPIMSFFDAATVKFTAHGSDFDISSGSTSGVLRGSSSFQLGWWSPQGWVTERSSSMVSLLGSSSWNLTFIDPAAPGYPGEHRLFGFDVKPSLATNDGPAAVPLPASVWLMTAALLGFLYTGRNKSNITA